MIGEEMYTTMAKVLSGEASPGEQQELEAWLASDPLHKKTFDELKSAWQGADLLLTQPQFDENTAWSKISPRIQAPAETNNPTRTFSIPRWQKYTLAAAAVLVIGLVTLWNIFATGTKIIVASAGNETVVLPDQSTVTLKSGSRLEYPRRFQAERRSVTLAGEAFFEVTRDEQRPFVIDAGAASVRVLGTSFNVRSKEDEVVVVVATGKVEVKSNQRTGLSLTLEPGQKAIAGNGLLERYTEAGNNYLFWKTGQLSFNSRPLDEVLQDLKNYAGLDIQFAPNSAPSYKSQAVTISFSGTSPEDILNELSLITNSSFSKQENSYIISSKN